MADLELSTVEGKRWTREFRKHVLHVESLSVHGPHWAGLPRDWPGIVWGEATARDGDGCLWPVRFELDVGEDRGWYRRALSNFEIEFNVAPVWHQGRDHGLRSRDGEQVTLQLPGGYVRVIPSPEFPLDSPPDGIAVPRVQKTGRAGHRRSTRAKDDAEAGAPGTPCTSGATIRPAG